MGVMARYKQTDVGVIPEDWEVAKLGDHATFRTGPFGSALHKADYVFHGVPVINPMQIVDGRLFPTARMTISESAARRLSEFRLSKGEVVIGRRGDMGRCAVVPVEADGWLCGTGSMIVRLKSTLEGRFAQRVLSDARTVAAIEAASVGTTMVNLNQGTLSNLKIPLPPNYEEQQAIAEVLSDADALVESLRQLLAKKRQIKQGAMQELLTGNKRLPGFIGKWQRRPLGDLVLSCTSGATPYRGRPDFYKGSVKWITSGELNYNVITDTVEHISEEAVRSTNLTVHPVGTFLLAITGLEAAGTRGACGIVGSPATTNQSCMAIYPSAELSARYLYHYYVLRGSELALRYCQGTKQQSYTAKLVKLLPIDLPPSLDEQKAIADVLFEMDSELDLLEEKVRKARQLKQGMMQELLTGRIRLV